MALEGSGLSVWGAVSGGLQGRWQGRWLGCWAAAATWQRRVSSAVVSLGRLCGGAAAAWGAGAWGDGQPEASEATSELQASLSRVSP